MNTPTPTDVIHQAANLIFLDTEFIEDGNTIDLLSIGLIRGDGATYYAEPEEADRTRANEWIKQNVLPTLTGPTKPRAVIAKEIIDFVGKSPEFWAWYADYDWVAICQLFGRMIDLPKGWPMYCRDFKQVCDERGIRVSQNNSRHNALGDAEWLATVARPVLSPLLPSSDPMAWMYSHDGQMDDDKHPIITRKRWSECEEPWTEEPLFTHPTPLLPIIRDIPEVQKGLSTEYQEAEASADEERKLALASNSRDRQIFDAGFNAAVRYGDNYFHYDGEQADRVFSKEMEVIAPLPSDPLPDSYFRELWDTIRKIDADYWESRRADRPEATAAEIAFDAGIQRHWPEISAFARRQLGDAKLTNGEPVAREAETAEGRTVHNAVTECERILDETVERWDEKVTADWCLVRITKALEALHDRPVRKCTVPPPGRRCTRHAGHSGPCVAIPEPIANQPMARKIAETSTPRLAERIRGHASSCESGTFEMPQGVAQYIAEMLKQDFAAQPYQAVKP